MWARFICLVDIVLAGGQMLLLDENRHADVKLCAACGNLQNLNVTVVLESSMELRVS